jgi:hypothetical protein
MREAHTGSKRFKTRKLLCERLVLNFKSPGSLNLKEALIFVYVANTLKKLGWNRVLVCQL